MNARQLRGAWLLVALAAVAAGCATRSPPTALYTLAPVASPATAHAAGPGVTVAGVSIADHLNRPEIVTRPEPHRMTVSDLHHWAGALDRAIAEVVAENLSRLLPSDRAVPGPWHDAPAADYTVSLRVQRFEGTLGGEAELAAHWVLRRASGGPPQLAAFRASEAVQGVDHAALVAAQSRLLGRLSEVIAARIRKLEGGR